MTDRIWLFEETAITNLIEMLRKSVSTRTYTDALLVADILEQHIKSHQPLPQSSVDVLMERARQIAGEEWTTEHDDEHVNGELALAAAHYAAEASFLRTDEHKHLFAPPLHGADLLTGHGLSWPWDTRWWKPGEPRRMLEKAAALCLAEMDRLDRITIRNQESCAHLGRIEGSSGFATEQRFLRCCECGAELDKLPREHPIVKNFFGDDDGSRSS